MADESIVKLPNLVLALWKKIYCSLLYFIKDELVIWIVEDIKVTATAYHSITTTENETSWFTAHISQVRWISSQLTWIGNEQLRVNELRFFESFDWFCYTFEGHCLSWRHCNKALAIGLLIEFFQYGEILIKFSQRQNENAFSSEPNCSKPS